MKKYRLETVEHSFDDVPWNGNGEGFNTISQCNQRVSELKKRVRDNDVTVYFIRNSDNKVLKINRLERLPYSF